MTNFTNEQLEAWAGLGPWSYRSQKHDDWGIVRTGRYIVCQARDHRFMDDGYLKLCREEKRDPHEIPARLIAAAPDLARLVLEKDAEIAELKAAIIDARLVAVDAQLRASYQRTALDIISDKLRQAMKETSDE